MLTKNSPVDGKVTVVFPTKHAIGINSNGGAELLMEFDVDGITSQGYDVTTPIIVTNSKNYNEVKVVANGQVKQNDKIIDLN